MKGFNRSSWHSPAAPSPRRPTLNPATEHEDDHAGEAGEEGSEEHACGREGTEVDDCMDTKVTVCIQSLSSPAALLVLLYCFIRSLNLTVTPGLHLRCCAQPDM